MILNTSSPPSYFLDGAVRDCWPGWVFFFPVKLYQSYSDLLSWKKPSSFPRYLPHELKVELVASHRVFS